jgi:hypothetical protein
MPVKSPVGFSSVHARANICETPHYSKPPTVSGNVGGVQKLKQNESKED